MRRVRVAHGAVAVTFGLFCVGCASATVPEAARAPATTRSTIPATVSTSRPQTRPIATHRSTTTSTSPEQPGWTVVAAPRGAIAVEQRTISFSDGAVVTVARFRVGQIRFALHVGRQDPPAPAQLVTSGAGPRVSRTERPRLLGAFNGGFKIASGSGGFQLNGTLLRGLRTGAASFVIDTNGSGHVGAWGRDFPQTGEQVASVRQNLAPLILGGQLNPQISRIIAWGSTFKGERAVARSALGEDSKGNILYAASMTVLPVDLGNALLVSGATRAMELDINPEWVQLALSGQAGGPLFPGVPGQHRPANQYLLGWSRDFVTVMSSR